jgi:hypothetical protein
MTDEREEPTPPKKPDGWGGNPDEPELETKTKPPQKKKDD